MSNQNEIDYEKQFREDLAKATALSLEQQALDEYNRSKKYEKARSYYEYGANNSSGRSRDEVMSQYYAQLRQRQYGRSYSNSTGATVTAATTIGAGGPSSVKRSNSEEPNNSSTITTTTTTTTTTTSTTSALTESDLISFNSPTSQKPAEHQTIEKLIEDLHKLQSNAPASNAQMLALVPTVPTAVPAYHQHQQAAAAAAQAIHHYPYMAPVAPYAGGLQLVPFQPTGSGSSNSQAQKTPLTHEQLKQLYNMPYGAPTQQQQVPPPPAPPLPLVGYATVMGFVRAPAPTSAAYMPPQYPRYNTYNYAATQYPASTLQQQTPYYKPPTTTANQTNPTHSKVVAASSSIIGKNNNNTSSSSSQSSNSNGYNASKVSGGSASIVTSKSSAMRRTSRAAVGDDLIDLNQDDDSRVSVLEAFDPLLNEGDPVLRKNTT